jgi:hypothetical protein
LTDGDPVPIVPTAYPLRPGFSAPAVRPDKALGYQACLNASAERKPEARRGRDRGGREDLRRSPGAGGLAIPGLKPKGPDRGRPGGGLAFGDVRTLQENHPGAHRRRTGLYKYLGLQKQGPAQTVRFRTFPGVVYQPGSTGRGRKWQLAQNGLIGSAVHCL